MIVNLINNDCLEELDKLEKESIDLVVTDCPYHIIGGGCSTGAYGNGNGIFQKTRTPSGILNREREYETKVLDSGRKVQVLKGTNHINLNGILDDNITYTRQGKLFKYNDINFSDWLPKVYRVLKNGTHCYIFINPRNLKELQQAAEDAGFKFQQLIVWDKGNATPNRYYLNAYEMILLLRKGAARNINNMGCKNILRVKNIIGKKDHPTEKPVELNKILIENSSNYGDTVLDPFMGVGTCGEACVELNRNFIGMEIDEKYYNIAKERLEK